MEGEELKQQNYRLYGKDQGKLMDLDTCMRLHVAQHQIALRHLGNIYKNKEELGQEMQMLPQKLSDLFYAETGVESVELD